MSFALSGGIQLDQLGGDVLYFFLGSRLELFPCVRSQFGELRNIALFTEVFRDFVQGVNAHVHNVIVLEN